MKTGQNIQKQAKRNLKVTVENDKHYCFKKVHRFEL